MYLILYTHQVCFLIDKYQSICMGYFLCPASPTGFVWFDSLRPSQFFLQPRNVLKLCQCVARGLKMCTCFGYTSKIDFVPFSAL